MQTGGPRASGATGNRLRVVEVDGASTAVEVRAANPLKLLVPRHRDRAVWAYAGTYGGGLLAGDRIDLAVDIGPGATALLATQASTKVYRSDDGRDSRQSLTCAVDHGGLFALLPDPVTCFAGARYVQDQGFDLHAGASLALLDWFTAGRCARDERWAFASYRSRNRVTVAGVDLLVDRLRLDDGAIPVGERMGGMEVCATLVLVGPRVAAQALALLGEVAAMPLRRDGMQQDTAMAIGASPLTLAGRAGAGHPVGAILRISGRSQESVDRTVQRHLVGLTADLGGDPRARRP